MFKCFEGLYKKLPRFNSIYTIIISIVSNTTEIIKLKCINISNSCSNSFSNSCSNNNYMKIENDLNRFLIDDECDVDIENVTSYKLFTHADEEILKSEIIEQNKIFDY
tara:strand:- start:249 stop:572 length:324 start_codon:yes stop_codon:yes gene_type:complete